MDIVFTIDEKFTRFCAVAIASLLKHNKTEEILVGGINLS